MVSDSVCRLFRRCLDHNDPDDWRRFVHRCGPRIRTLIAGAMRRCRLPATEPDREELVQELYCRLLRSGTDASPTSDDAPVFQGRSWPELHSYLWQAARAVVVDRVRSRRAAKRARTGDTRRPPSWLLPWADPPSPEEHAIRRDTLRGFYRHCRGYARGRRADLKMRIIRQALVEGFTSREIARELRGRVTPGQVDSLIFRLRQHLSDSGVPVPARHAGNLGRRAGSRI